jgi:hypothetical protein
MEQISMGRARTCDVSIAYRMAAGFPGDISRTHPATVEPAEMDPNNPPTAYGQAVVVDATTQGVRPLGASDGSLTDIYGITVRPFPIQTSTTSNAGIGAVTPPVTGPMDVIRRGCMMATLNGSTLSAKGQPVYVWIAASTGNHVQGGFEAAASTGNTIQLGMKTTFNGPPDANGVVEIELNI